MVERGEQAMVVGSQRCELPIVSNGSTALAAEMLKNCFPAQVNSTRFPFDRISRQTFANAFCWQTFVMSLCLVAVKN
jgi:hypothetical protein